MVGSFFVSLSSSFQNLTCPYPVHHLEPFVACPLPNLGSSCHPLSSLNHPFNKPDATRTSRKRRRQFRNKRRKPSTTSGVSALEGSGCWRRAGGGGNFKPKQKYSAMDSVGLKPLQNGQTIKTVGVNFIHTSWIAFSIGGKSIQPVNSKILHSSLITHHSSLSSSSSSSSSWSSSWSWSWSSSWSVVVVVVVVAVLAAAANAAVAWVDGGRWKHDKLSISSFHPLINTGKHQRVKSRFSHKSDVSNLWILEIQPWNLLIHGILVVAAPSDPPTPWDPNKARTNSTSNT